MRRVRWLSLIAGAACAVLVFAALAAGGGGRAPGAAVTVPDRLAAYSHLTGDVSDAPPGRALALYQHGFGVELLDFPQAVVLAADDDVYRRLDAAEARSGPETQGDPGPMLLSPDGRWVAVGDHDTTSAILEVVDLESGDVVRRPLPDARSVRPAAWSPDGSRLLYLADDEPTNPYRGAAPMVGRLLMLDVASGRVEPVPGGTQASGSAYSPDGTLLAIQRYGGRAPGVAIVRPSTGAVRVLPVEGRLAGPHAWSPDGRLLAVTRASAIWLADAAGAPGAAPERLELEQPASHELLGWTGSRGVLVLDHSAPDRSRVFTLSLDDGTSRELTHVDGTASYGVGRLQLATALTEELAVRQAEGPDRGPLPTAPSAVAALLAGLGATVMASRIGRRRHRRDRTAGSATPQP